MLFEGPQHSRRPVCTAESRSSGLFKILGEMVGHSIIQEGIGFPFFSQVCYSYMVGGEDRAMEQVSLTDLSEPAAIVVQKVCIACSKCRIVQVKTSQNCSLIIIQLKDAQSDDIINGLAQDSLVIDVMDRLKVSLSIF